MVQVERGQGSLLGRRSGREHSQLQVTSVNEATRRGCQIRVALSQRSRRLRQSQPLLGPCNGQQVGRLLTQDGVLLCERGILGLLTSALQYEHQHWCAVTPNLPAGGLA